MSKQTSFLLGDFHTVMTLLNRDPGRVIRLWLQTDREDGRIKELTKLAEQHSIRPALMPKNWLDQRDPHHQGLLAECYALPLLDEHDLEDFLPPKIQKPPLLLVLDGVTDPHNLGACLRSAAVFGVTAVVSPKDRAVGLTPTVCKIACGGAEIVPFIQVTNLARALTKIRDAGMFVVGMAGEATQHLATLPLTSAIAIVMGAEDKGLRRLTREHCDALAKIPMVWQEASLNVSVATGIALYEVVRQREHLLI